MTFVSKKLFDTTLAMDVALAPQKNELTMAQIQWMKFVNTLSCLEMQDVHGNRIVIDYSGITDHTYGMQFCFQFDNAQSCQELENSVNGWILNPLGPAFEALRIHIASPHSIRLLSAISHVRNLSMTTRLETATRRMHIFLEQRADNSLEALSLIAPTANDSKEDSLVCEFRVIRMQCMPVDVGVVVNMPSRVDEYTLNRILNWRIQDTFDVSISHMAANDMTTIRLETMEDREHCNKIVLAFMKCALCKLEMMMNDDDDVCSFLDVLSFACITSEYAQRMSLPKPTISRNYIFGEGDGKLLSECIKLTQI